eukprot:gnl/Chilomastix_caulleri/2067.p1 GENE.gnl/Chilomastix_caulleri/2067~~gnl/Chilomastix_caulleri/2067.p1  ORF type:complete len:89 (+),score=9.98 gnl/Chilomastix_caulleri/2067:31-297(+)
MIPSTKLQGETDALTQAVEDLIVKACAPYEVLVVKVGERKWNAKFYTTTPYNPYPSLTVKVLLRWDLLVVALRITLQSSLKVFPPCPT